jgi:hypothetical protein
VGAQVREVQKVVQTERRAGRPHYTRGDVETLRGLGRVCAALVCISGGAADSVQALSQQDYTKSAPASGLNMKTLKQAIQDLSPEEFLKREQSLVRRPYGISKNNLNKKVCACRKCARNRRELKKMVRAVYSERA